MGDRHLSRRELLDAIPILGRGSLLIPLISQCARAAPANGILRGKLVEKATGRLVAAKMRVTDAVTGEPYGPAAAVKSMPKRSPSGVRYFYAREEYEIALPAGRYQVEAVRGISQEAEVATVEVAAQKTLARDFQFKPVGDLGGGWYSGNTHTHYNVDIEETVDDRLRIVPHAEGVDVSVISYLIRNRLPYASNRIPIGRLPGFSRDGVLMDMGEECRNNFISRERPHNLGYGHCLFLNIPRLVEPVSTGQLRRARTRPTSPPFPCCAPKPSGSGGPRSGAITGTGWKRRWPWRWATWMR